MPITETATRPPAAIALVLAALITALVLSLAAPSAADAATQPGVRAAANGCGPNDWRGRFVPNGVRFLYNFKAACNKHDNCYGTWRRAKSACDSQFHTNMVRTCGGLRIINCRAAAQAYYRAVRHFGNGAYNNGQRGAGLRRPLSVKFWMKPATTTRNRLTRFAWSVGNGYALNVTCRLDGALRSCPGSSLLFGVRPGMHKFSVTARNHKGSYTATHYWLVK